MAAGHAGHNRPSCPWTEDWDLLALSARDVFDREIAEHHGLDGIHYNFWRRRGGQERHLRLWSPDDPYARQLIDLFLELADAKAGSGYVDISTDLLRDIEVQDAQPLDQDNAEDRAIAGMLRRTGHTEEQIVARFGYSPTPFPDEES